MSPTLTHPQNAPESLSRGSHTWIGPLLLAAGYAVYCHLFDYVSDDGFIGFRYVEQWLAGNGLVYNPGERVEGYTNFLWLVLLAGSRLIVPSAELLAIAQFWGVLFGALSIVVVCRFSLRSIGETSGWSLLAGALLAIHTSFVAWATSGLETTLYAFVVLVAACSYASHLAGRGGLLWSSGLFALAAMTRPEAILLFGLTSAHLALREGFERRRWLGWLAIFGVVYGTYWLGRFAYYGDPLPNTFYAKVGMGADSWALGWDYLRRYALRTGVWVLVPVVWRLLRTPRHAWRDYFALLVVGQMIYIASVGGDGLAFFRFVAHVAPLLYLLIQDGYANLAREISRRWPRARPAIALGIWIAIGLTLGTTARQGARFLLFPEQTRWLEKQSGLHFPGIGSDHEYRWFDNYFVDRQAVAARWLDANAPVNSLVASTPAGSIASHMSHRVLDMLGLNDRHIARTEAGQVGFPRAGHMKGDGAYVLSRRPEYILLGNVAVLPRPLDRESIADKLVRKSEHEIWSDSRFHRDYELVSVRVGESGVFQYFTFFQRRDLSALAGPGDDQ